MSTTATRSRGRPRKFDEEEVLDALTRLFWRQGYESTSMTDIVETSGMNKSSLYNTFGSKQELFTRVLDRYIDARMVLLNSMVAETNGGIEALHLFLNFIRVELDTECGSQGCLAVNISAEVGRSDETITAFSQRYRDRMRGAIHGLMESVAGKGQLDPAQLGHHADMLMLFMLGISVAVRGGAGSTELDRLVDSAHATVDSWRT